LNFIKSWGNYYNIKRNDHIYKDHIFNHTKLKIKKKSKKVNASSNQGKNHWLNTKTGKTKNLKKKKKAIANENAMKNIDWAPNIFFKKSNNIVRD
jgi:hypothetical protein